ncbi:hypothetical protein Cpir12675_005423 [Ceratocystis pirilliformis]|uniref:Uncharacterized protein n=1 Tax=Ceratocystis pirilliformis TaxID=259994 RepID=A0ABR3YR70_9PEZI
MSVIFTTANSDEKCSHDWNEADYGLTEISPAVGRRTHFDAYQSIVWGLFGRLAPGEQIWARTTNSVLDDVGNHNTHKD